MGTPDVSPPFRRAGGVLKKVHEAVKGPRPRAMAGKEGTKKGAALSAELRGAAAGRIKVKGPEASGKKDPSKGRRARRNAPSKRARSGRRLKKPSNPLGRKELKEKKVAELRAIAKKMGIALRATRKAAIIDEIIRKARGAAKEKDVTPVIPKGVVLRPLRPVIMEETEEEKIYGPAIIRPLPEGPEKDIITAIAVEPGQIFAFWELTDKTARKGAPALRVHDVTGPEVKKGRRGRTKDFFDIRLPQSAGGLYISVRPGREYVVHAGVLGPGGRFISARKSRKVSTPPAGPSKGKTVLPERYYRFHPTRYRG
jgi:hypothetical protein